MRWIIGLVLTLAMSLMVSTAFAASSAYDDVPTDHWAYNALDYLTERGVLEGYPDGFFKGDRTLTRYEFAQAVARLLNTIEGGDSSADIKVQADALRAEFSDQLAQISSALNEQGLLLNDLDGRVGDLEGKVSDTASKLGELDKKVSGMKPGPEWKGDFRYRWQYETRESAGGDSNDRFRQRIRFRLGYNKKVNDTTEIGFRLSTETGVSKISGNFTLGGAGGETAGIFLDRAYVKHSPTWFGSYNDADCKEHAKLDIYAGIYPNLMYDPHELILDHDVNFQGAGVVYHFNEDFQLTTAMSIAVEENTGEVDDDAVFYGTELRHTNLLICGLDAWIGCYGWKNESSLDPADFRWNRMDGFNFNNNGDPNETGDRLSTNFNTIKGGLQYTFQCVWNKPLAVWGEYMVNIDSDADERIALVNTLVNPDIIYEETDDIGIGYGVQWGESPSAKGDWMWFASYKEIGANAAINGFGDSDAGGPNLNSLEAGVAWNWADNATLGITYFLNKMNNAFGFQIPSGRQDHQIVQVDWSFKF